jgi:hypothetical protein
MMLRSLIVFLLLWTGAAQAQLGQIPVGSAGGAAPLSPVALTFQHAALGSSSGTTYTIGPIAICPNSCSGSSSNRRLTFAIASGDLGSGNAISGTPVFTPDVGSPVNADTVISAGKDPSQSWSLILVSAVVPTGVNITLTINFTGSVFNAPRYGFYTLDNSTLSAPTTPTHTFTASTTSPTSASIAVPSGAGLIAQWWGFGVSTVTGWTGVTSDITGSSVGQASFDFGHISNATASASYSVSNGWTVSGSGNPDLALWVYR